MYQFDTFEDALNEGIVFEARTRDSKWNDHAMQQARFYLIRPTGNGRQHLLQVFLEPSAMVMLFSGRFLTCLLGAGISGAKCTKLMSMR